MTTKTALDLEDITTTTPEIINGNGSGLDFDLEALRLPQTFDVGVKRALITIPVRRPDRQAWIRVHPAESYRVQTLVLEMKDERVTYLIHPRLRGLVSAEASPVLLLTAITRQNVLFLWPCKLPAADGRRNANAWHSSALEIANLAMTRWVRVAANMALGAYEAHVATGEIGDPEWPSESFMELVAIAFKNRIVDSEDHPALRALRGEA